MVKTKKKPVRKMNETRIRRDSKSGIKKKTKILETISLVT